MSPRPSSGSTTAYEARFGFRYCVFVAGRSREALLPGLERRARRRPRARAPPRARRGGRHRRRPLCDAACGSHGGRIVIELTADRYGKAAIRIVRVGREATPHDLRDLTVAIALEGDFAAAHTDGDNSLVVATDTMKNTAYAFAAEHLTGSIEAYAIGARAPLPRASTRSSGRRSTSASTPGGRSTSRGRRRPMRSCVAARAPAWRPWRRRRTAWSSRPASRTSSS